MTPAPHLKVAPSSSGSLPESNGSVRPLKVLDLTDFYSDHGGGIRSHLTAKGRYLATHGIDHLVLAPGRRDEEELLVEDGSTVGPGAENPATARVVRVGGISQPYDPSYHLPLRLDRIRSRIVAERPDVLELNSTYLMAMAASVAPRKSYGIRTVMWHSRHLDIWVTPPLTRCFGSTLARIAIEPAFSIIRALGRRSAANIVASKFQRDQLARIGVPRVVLIPFGVDKRTFNPGARSIARRLELIGPDQAHCHIIVGVGRLSTEKRWALVLEAFQRVKQRHRVVMVLFGDGPERERLQAMAREIGSVILPGFDRDRHRLASALASADLLVHGSEWETFGLGVAEAIASGLPIVVPNKGAAAEQAYGASSATFEAGDASSCATAINSLLGCDRSTLRSAALERALQADSSDAHFAKLLELYRDLLNRRSA